MRISDWGSDVCSSDLVWRVRRGEDELLFAEQGAQILSYRQGDAPPIIWLSEEAAFQQGQSVRGGVPICWPWFGDLARNPQTVQASYHGEQPAPFHGLNSEARP